MKKTEPRTIKEALACIQEVNSAFSQKWNALAYVLRFIIKQHHGEINEDNTDI